MRLRTSAEQLGLPGLEAGGLPKADTTSTFLDSMSLPIHRWFRYSAGFSAQWVAELIQEQKAKGRYRVLDPFAGSGTVLLEGESCGVESIGLEAHPFVARVARAKLNWREPPKAFREFALSILEQARTCEGDTESYPRLIGKCFMPEALAQLDALKKAWEGTADGSPLSELTWLALVSILRECSPVGTAQWQYVLPTKIKAKAAEPYEAFAAKVHLMADDMTRQQRREHGPQGQLFQEDARVGASIVDGWADFVITSPPYANNYDYADATRLEMTFFGEIRGWGDLQGAVRRHLVRSCTQHVAGLNGEVYSILQDPILDPIKVELHSACEQLTQEREKHGGRKTYHTMVAAYFQDMANVWKALRRVTCQGASVCFVVGDSAPYGIHVPVERWLGDLALAEGFKTYRFEKTRDRNVKWKNRKHRVPLHEGQLWVEG